MSDEIKVGDRVRILGYSSAYKVLHTYTNENGAKYSTVVCDMGRPTVVNHNSLKRLPEVVKVWVICYSMSTRDPITYMVYSQERAEELVNVWTKQGYKIFGVKCVEFEV